jgi:hypothetical protein
MQAGRDNSKTTGRPKRSETEARYWTRGSPKQTEISLGGVRVKVRTDATPSNLKLVRDLVEGRFDEFADRLERGMTAHQLMVLVAFNLAEDLIREREKLRFLKKRVVENGERLLSRVEARLSRELASKPASQKTKQTR